jgi:hypothetical protein
MPNKTLKGYQLAETLRSRGVEVNVITCSLIARHATSYQKNQEDICNGHPANGAGWIDIKTARRLQEEWEARTERKSERLEMRITQICKDIEGIAAVYFQGDPRGLCIQLIPAKSYDPSRKIHDQRDSIGVPVN